MYFISREDSLLVASNGKFVAVGVICDEINSEY